MPRCVTSLECCLSHDQRSESFPQILTPHTAAKQFNVTVVVARKDGCILSIYWSSSFLPSTMYSSRSQAESDRRHLKELNVTKRWLVLASFPAEIDVPSTTCPVTEDGKGQQRSAIGDGSGHWPTLSLADASRSSRSHHTALQLFLLKARHGPSVGGWRGGSAERWMILLPLVLPFFFLFLGVVSFRRTLSRDIIVPI